LIAALIAARDYVILNFLKKRAFVNHLREKKLAWIAAGKPKKGKIKRMFTAVHLARHVKITAEEAVKLGWTSKKIVVRIKKNPKGYADALLFEYLVPKEEDTEPEETEPSAYAEVDADEVAVLLT